jgi:glycosyltransferase involved in cell wall biosynthesis
MKKLGILLVHDSSSFAFNLQKYLPAEVNAIYYSSHDAISQVKDPLFFVKNGIESMVNQIKDLSKKYDVFLCYGWPALAICYLARVNYGIVFFDAYIDPEYRIRKKISPIKEAILQDIYKSAIKHATFAVAGLPHDAEILKKYRPDTKIIHQLIDEEMFNSHVKQIELDKSKFTFFSPQRIEPDKGQLIMWNAIRMSKSDFVVLQTDWGSGEHYEKALATKPDKVKIIPKIKRKNMPNYLVSVDALLGQISKTSIGSTEREAALCGIPVFCYAPYSFSEDDPFYKESKEPEDIAKYIDRIVADKNFREELKKKQKEWVKATFDNKRTVNQWLEVFEKAINDKITYKVKFRHRLIIKIISMIEKILQKDISSMARNVK